MFFDSLVHATPDGGWLDQNRYDASYARLIAEMNEVSPSRALLVNIAGYHDNRDLLTFARQHEDAFVPIAGLNPVRPPDGQGPEDAVARLASLGFPGIKLHSRLNRYDPLCDEALAVMRAAGEHGMVVLLDSLFRQHSTRTQHPSDIVDAVVHECPETDVLLLHGGGAHILEMFEMARMHSRLFLDLSFTLTRYAGSSIDLDIRFLCETLDQKLTVGSDFPEYTPREARDRLLALTAGIDHDKLENVFYKNLQRLFERYQGLGDPGDEPF